MPSFSSASQQAPSVMTDHSYMHDCVRIFATTLMALATPSHAQAAHPTPEFEVASVRPVSHEQHFRPTHYGVHTSGNGVSFWSMSFVSLMAYAYSVGQDQVEGPSWTTRERFDIEARTPAVGDEKQDREMLRSLLKDRFGLTFHVEQKALVVYALRADKEGSKLPSMQVNTGVLPLNSSSETPNQVVTFDRAKWVQHWDIHNTSMTALADRLGVCLGSSYHRVVDETGLGGNYSLAFDCPIPRPNNPQKPEGESAPPPSEDNAVLAESLGHLGLHLEKHKVLLKVYILDHVAFPSDN